MVLKITNLHILRYLSTCWLYLLECYTIDNQRCTHTVNGYCTFGDVTVELCQKFRQYLLNCKQIRHPNISVSRNSAAGYFSTFRALLKIAYQEKMLRENLNDFIDKIEWKEGGCKLNCVSKE